MCWAGPKGNPQDGFGALTSSGIVEVCFLFQILSRESCKISVCSAEVTCLCSEVCRLRLILLRYLNSAPPIRFGNHESEEMLQSLPLSIRLRCNRHQNQRKIQMQVSCSCDPVLYGICSLNDAACLYDLFI